MAKVIISCAVTGGIHTPSIAAVSADPPEIARSSIRRRRAGAAIIHLRARRTRRVTDPGPGGVHAVSADDQTDAGAVINITTGGGLNMTLDDRLAAPLVARPEMCSLNMGSMNFNISPAAGG